LKPAGNVLQGSPGYYTLAGHPVGYHGDADLREDAVCHSQARPDGVRRGICHLDAACVLWTQSVKANVFQSQRVKANVFQTQRAKANVYQTQLVNANVFWRQCVTAMRVRSGFVGAFAIWTLRGSYGRCVSRLMPSRRCVSRQMSSRHSFSRLISSGRSVPRRSASGRGVSRHLPSGHSACLTHTEFQGKCLPDATVTATVPYYLTYKVHPINASTIGRDALGAR